MPHAATLDDDLLAHVRLACVTGIGDRRRRLLLDRFGSPRAVFAAPAREIAADESIRRSYLGY